jgi:hypothetical protein
MEVSDVRRRLRAAIDDARRQAEQRRTRKDEASRAWERMLTEVAVPAFHVVASALTGEGYRFKVVTPGEAVRLMPERGEEFIELALDGDREDPVLMLRTTRGRGRRMVSSERIFKNGPAMAEFTDEEVVAAVLHELIPFVER